jgi:hypothetical protein
VWSKAGRFVEGLHTVGDIFTKISVNCVLNYMLHYYLCVYFYGFLCVWFIPVFIFMGIVVYAACICLLLFCMNLCIYKMYLSVLSFIYKVLQEFLCVYVLICIQFDFFFMWHSPVGCWGCYNMVSELQFSTLSLDGPRKLS